MSSDQHAFPYPSSATAIQPETRWNINPSPDYHAAMDRPSRAAYQDHPSTHLSSVANTPVDPNLTGPSYDEGVYQAWDELPSPGNGPAQSAPESSLSPSSYFGVMSSNGGMTESIMGTSVEIEDDKRRRNTAASARFRLKKKEREAELERTTKDMNDRCDELQRKIGALETENRWLRELITERSRNRGRRRLKDRNWDKEKEKKKKISQQEKEYE